MSYYVYILTNQRNTVLYTGVTNNLEKKVLEHKIKLNPGFTAKYNCEKLVYFEAFSDVNKAIVSERQVKKYRREWKENLIKGMNSDWADLSQDWHNEDGLTLAKDQDILMGGGIAEQVRDDSSK